MKVFIQLLLLIAITCGGNCDNVSIGDVHHHHHIGDEHDHHLEHQDNVVYRTEKNNIKASPGVHLSHSTAIVIDNDHVSEHHPVYHHNVNNHYDDHQDELNHADYSVIAKTAKVVHHDAIHQVEPVHHVTKVIHHEPHHFLHYINPLVDHHVIHRNEDHVNQHHYAQDLHHNELHDVNDHHHYHSQQLVDHHQEAHDLHHINVPHYHLQHYQRGAPLDHHNYFHHHLQTPSTAVHGEFRPTAIHSPSIPLKSYLPPVNTKVLDFARQKLQGKYGKVRITEQHFDK